MSNRTADDNQSDLARERAPSPNLDAGKVPDEYESQSIRSRNDGQQADPDPMEMLKTCWNFVTNPHHANAIMAIATVLIFLSGVVYTVFSALQWQANRKAACAAESAANTARDALYISERAYIDIFAPTLDISKKSVFLPITNTGHIPSGRIIVEVHRALFNPPFADAYPDNYPVEPHWRRSYLDGIPNGSPVQIIVPFKRMDRQRLVAGTEEIFVAGTISYADGFPNTAQAIKAFCWRSINSTTAQLINLSPCDTQTVIPILKKLDGYPNNEETDAKNE